MKPYADTNLFTRLYLGLPGVEVVDSLLAQARLAGAGPLPVTWLHRLEVVNALQFSVWLGRQPGHPTVNPQQAAMAQETFREDLSTSIFLHAARLEESTLTEQFGQMALRHTARHGFRTYDLLHVAAACLLGCDAFWSFDGRAQKLAELEGLPVPDACRS